MLNILPIEKKKELQRESILRSVNQWFVFIIILLGITTIVLIITELGIRSWNAQLQRERAISAPLDAATSESLEGSIDRLNDVLSAYLLSKRNTSNPIMPIHTVLQSLPVGVSLQSLEYSVDTNELSFSGVAPNRDTLNALQSSLTGNSSLQDTSVQIENLSNETNIRFSVTTRYSL